MSEESEDQEKKQPIYIGFKGDETIIHHRSVKKWNRGEYYNGIRNVYTITIHHFDMDDTVMEYFELEVRDVEYSNFMDKMRELGAIFM